MPHRSPASKTDEKEAAQKVRNYFAALTPATRTRLKELREIILIAAPDVTEGFSYGMPAFTLNGKTLVWYAAWKEHLSLYPIGTAALSDDAEALAKYETAKGTVRFPLSEPLPAALVKRLVKARSAELLKKRAP